jgi:hypothetical protein
MKGNLMINAISEDKKGIFLIGTLPYPVYQKFERGL